MESENSKTAENSVNESVENRVDVQDLQARIEQLEASKNRVLEESKQWKSKYQSLRGESEEQERLNMEKKQDFEGLLQKANQKIAELSNAVELREEALFKKSVHFEVSKHCTDAHDVDDVIGSISYDKDDVDLENLTLRNLSEKLDDVRKRKPHLFRNDPAKMQTKMPGFDGSKEKVLGDMSKAELYEKYKLNLKRK